MALPSTGKAWSDKLKIISPAFGLLEDPIHPIQIALRTYALSISLSLGSSLVPLISTHNKLSRNVTNRSGRLREVLRRELALDGFASALTIAVGGGAALQHLWSMLSGWHWDTSARSKLQSENSANRSSRGFAVVLGKVRTLVISSRSLPVYQRSFISNMISSSLAILLLQAGRYRSYRLRPSSAGSAPRPPLTLDLTILLMVRAVDALVQSFVFKRTDTSESIIGGERNVKTDILKASLKKEQREQESSGKGQRLTTQIDAFVFWACSARIMWCFFYEPQRLPRSYVKWIRTLANVDGRLIKVLQAIRAKQWSYLTGSPTHSYLLTTFAEDLGRPASWGDPAILPAYGGPNANAIWKTIGVNGRLNVGGLPCEIAHGGIGARIGLGDSCGTNVFLRFCQAFLEAIALYLPAHLLPILLTCPHAILRPRRILSTFLAVARSATFLSSFVSTYWLAVCLTRTLLLARLFPWISHDFWDGPYGCVLVGCMMCGSSIWIENGRRRGEIALYVLPRAVRACLPNAWVRSGKPGIRVVERLAFIVSLAYLLTTATHNPGSLRGLSRWTLAFITKGSNAGFWKQKRQDPIPSGPHTPIYPSEIITPSTSTFTTVASE